MAHNSYIWMFVHEHSGEHYGQLVVYYRTNNLVPADHFMLRNALVSDA